MTQYPKKDNLTPEEVDGELRAALDIWEGETRLKFIKVPDKADIQISFHEGDHGDELPFDGPGGNLGHAYFPRYGGDVHIDDEESWTIMSNQGENLRYIFTHELGHSLGLDHTPIRNAIMYPNSPGAVKSVKLSDDDIKAIKALY